MTAEKEWSENPEDDPIEIQKQQLQLAKEFMAKVKAQEEEAKAKEAEYRAAGPIGAVPYIPPTFEEVSAVLKKAWDEVERIMPSAGNRAKAYAFQTLTHAAAPRPSFMG